MEAEGYRRRGVRGLWWTRGPSQDRAGEGQAGGLGKRRMERRCAGAVDALGVAGGEMGEDSLDEFGRFDARDDAQGTATYATVFVSAPQGWTNPRTGRWREDRHA